MASAPGSRPPGRSTSSISVIYDPDLTVGLPPEMSASSGVKRARIVRDRGGAGVPVRMPDVMAYMEYMTAMTSRDEL
jgi:hypothetical protein